MARQIQLTTHLPEELIAKIDEAAKEESEAADRLTRTPKHQTPRHHMPRNAMIRRLVEIGLELGPYGKQKAKADKAWAGP